MKDTIFALIEAEEKRQQETLQLIPSENMVSSAVREAVGSVLMHKYAEGQVGQRYYQGNGVVDEVEALCKRRALQTFGLEAEDWGVNVQALSGSPANLAIYNALLSPGEKILSMFLPDGGHLSHGWHVPSDKLKTNNEKQETIEKKHISIVSKFWEVEFYKTDPQTQLFDYDVILEQAENYKPKMIVSGGTAYPREIDHERMAAIAASVGAYYLADVSHESGLIAGSANQSPFPYADVVMMTTHKTLRGPRGALVFSRRKFNRRIQDTTNKEQTNSKSQPSKNQTYDLSKLIDFSVFPEIQGGPHLHTIAGIAVALSEAQTGEFANYARAVVDNAIVLASELKERGFEVVSGGTDKHLVLVDLRKQSLSGWTVAWALEAAGMIVNKNTVPGETASPIYPSGIRLGTPTVTSRGMGETEMRQIAEWMGQVVELVADKRLPEEKEARQEFVREYLEWVGESEELKAIGEEVKELCLSFKI